MTRSRGKSCTHTGIHCLRVTVGVIAGALMLNLVLTSAALAVPQDPKSFEVTLDCEGLDDLIVVVHPGIGRPLWDVSSAEVSNEPNYLIKSVDQDVYIDGVFIGSFSYRFGNKFGVGTPIKCTYQESLIDADGHLIEIDANSEVVPKQR